MMQYYLKIVPTDIDSFISTVKTYQYSVKENYRTINHHSGSHGVPGLYFKYDMSALKVVVCLDRDNIIRFCIRLCSFISGIVVIAGLLNSLIQYFLRGFVKTVAPQLVQHIKDVEKHNIKIPVAETIKTNSNLFPKSQKNLLIDVSNKAGQSPYL